MMESQTTLTTVQIRQIQDNKTPTEMLVVTRAIRVRTIRTTMQMVMEHVCRRISAPMTGIRPFRVCAGAEFRIRTVTQTELPTVRITVRTRQIRLKPIWIGMEMATSVPLIEMEITFSTGMITVRTFQIRIKLTALETVSATRAMWLPTEMVTGSPTILITVLIIQIRDSKMPMAMLAVTRATSVRTIRTTILTVMECVFRKISAPMTGIRPFRVCAGAEFRIRTVTETELRTVRITVM